MEAFYPPTLFSRPIDVKAILTQPQASQTCCFVASKQVGTLMYAIELLVSVTLASMRGMIA
jgi:hypothetical protein